MKNRVVENVMKYITGLRNEYSHDDVSNPEIVDGSLFFKIQPDGIPNMIYQVDLLTGDARHIGTTRGSFWTEWERGAFLDRTE